MEKSEIHLMTILDTRREKSNGKYPIKLRITVHRKRKYYGVGQEASVSEWEQLNSTSTKGRLRKRKQILTKIEEDALACCEKLQPFTFKSFEKSFFNNRIVFQSLKSAYESYIHRLTENNQHGTATAYQTAINTLLKYKPDLSIEDIDVDFLRDFENWMLGKKKSITTVGIYLRSLRAILNMAKDNGIIKPEDYPFGRRKYIIPTGKNIKRALNIEDIKKIFNYPTLPDSPYDKAKDFWIFSYLCNGINMKDIVMLRWCDLSDETITFERAKTIRTTRSNPIKIVALRNGHINKIISKWGLPYKRSNESYLFGIIEDTDTEERARKKIQQFTKVTNKYLKRIGEELNLDLKLTTYVARHSFATILVRGGAPLEMASQALGHSSLLTTQKYFAGFDLRKQAEYTKSLTDFGY